MQTLNKEIGESWKNLTDEEKEGYNKAAERRRGKETKVKTSSEVAKKLKQLEKLSEELDELGVEALMVTLYNGRIRAFGSQKDLIKDEKFGGYIENQLKSAEHQRKAAQCLTIDRCRRNSDREGSTGTTGENHDVTGRSGSSTSSVSKRRKKNKEAQQGSQQHSSSTSASSTQETTVTAEGLLPRTTDIPQNTGTPVHVVLPHRAPSTPARPNTGNLELLAQQSATLTDPHNSIPASPHNTGTPAHLAPQTTPTESQTGFHYLYRSNMPLELLNSTTEPTCCPANISNARNTSDDNRRTSTHGITDPHSSELRDFCAIPGDSNGSSGTYRSRYNKRTVSSQSTTAFRCSTPVTDLFVYHLCDLVHLFLTSLVARIPGQGGGTSYVSVEEADCWNRVQWRGFDSLCGPVLFNTLPRNGTIQAAMLVWTDVRWTYYIGEHERRNYD
ncbi:hypothetical protein Bbelb_087270 [Branchiostoma belcheri]|nr:hypothetical protein Bbelb_087270 [Branchiostoma belcheri]